MKRWVATVDLVTLEVESDPTFKFKCIENCGLCCERLEIPLRDEDIERIEGLGYNTWEFVDYEKLFYRGGDKFLGYAIKKNPPLLMHASFSIQKQRSAKSTTTGHSHAGCIHLSLLKTGGREWRSILRKIHSALALTIPTVNQSPKISS